MFAPKELIPDELRESLIDTFVDQNAHLGTREQKLFCFLESSDGRLTRDSRESLQKIFEGFSTFQVVEKRLDGHSGSAKHRGSAKNLPVFDDDFHRLIIPRSFEPGRTPKR